ncbi:MAG: diversity-generating retroelement protein Avd [Anaerolineae bacterium]|nr:diversity-generating retroelement protein Avd [Anaerolineae bacterium]
MSQSPIFVKTYDLLLWLIPRTTKFPREQRFVLARHVQDVALRFQEHLIEAGTLPGRNRGGKLSLLNRADVELTKLRFHLRLCRDLELLDAGQHRHVSLMVDEIGRLLGGWFKALGAASQQQPVPDLPQ